MARFVGVSGEPGVGKTRLFEEFARLGEERGWLVLGGRGAEFERELPFGIWVDVLDDHLAWLGIERVRRMLGDRVGELASVLPFGVLEEVAVPAVVLPDERYRAHRAVRALLEGIAGARPLMVLLDDLQWADGASLELLGHLLRRPPRAALVVALAFRFGRLPPSVVAALEAADRDGLVVDVRLGPLPLSDVDALLGEQLAAPVRAELHRVSGGNPFYLLQLARSGARADASVAREAGALAGVPPGVAVALGQEIHALGEPARLLAQGAAVAGDPVEFELAAAAADLAEPAALGALDEAVAAGLLYPTAVARRFRFRHPIVRRAVYESAGEGWRLAAHARAAAALAGHGGSLAARAQHLERCARPGDEAALGLLIEAGRDAAPRAPASAIRWYAGALRLLSSRPEDAQRRLELLVALAGALAVTGRLERALATLLEALVLVPAPLAELRVSLVAACATCENLLGRHQAAHDRLLGTLRELPEAHSGAAGALQVELAADALFDTDFAAMAGWAEAAQTTARELQDRGLNAVAGALLCFARYGQGELDAAAQARVEAAAALDELPDERLAERVDGAYYLGFAEFFCERYDDALRHLRRGIAVSRATGQGQFLVPMLVGLAHALEVRGQLREALDTAEGAVEAARLAENRQVTSWALVAEGWIAAMTGDLQRAERAAEDAVELLKGLDESVLTLAAHAHAAAIFLETGRPERCLEQARSAGAPELARIEPGRRAWLLAALARAELARGHPAGAHAWLARAERLLPGLQLPLAEAAVLHAQALLALEAGDAPGAGRLAQRAAERATTVGAAIQAARSAVLAGQALAAAGEREAALATLAAAEADLTACGAHRFRDEAAHQLRRLGQRVSARQRRFAPAEGLAALSGREREIAELVALGRTNREIAAELFLAEKTIEGHLSHVFTKLGVSSRTAVAAAVARAQTTTP